MKNKLLIFIIGGLIILQFSFILIQAEGEPIEVGENLTDLSTIDGVPFSLDNESTLHGRNLKILENGDMSFVGDKGKIIFNKDKDNEIVLEGTEGIKVSFLGKITFVEEGASVTINGNKFENIAKFDEKWDDEPPFILMDQKTGEISKAKFKTLSGKSGFIILNGNEFNFSEGMAWVDYDKNKEKLSLKGGARWEKIKIKSLKGPITLSGRHVNFFDKFVLKRGELKVDSEGNFFSTGRTNINYGINIWSEDKVNVPLFFDGEVHEKGISFLEDKIITSNQGEKSFEIIFEQGGEDIDEMKDYWNIQSENYIRDGVKLICPPGSKAIFENRDAEGLIPQLNVGGNLIIREGEKEIYCNEQNREWILDNYYTGYGGEGPQSSALEIVSESSDKKVFVGKGNKYSVISDSAEAQRLRCKITKKITGNPICEIYSEQELTQDPNSNRKHNYQDLPIFNFKANVQQIDSLVKKGNLDEVIELAKRANENDKNSLNKTCRYLNSYFGTMLMILSDKGIKITPETCKNGIKSSLKDHDWIAVEKWAKMKKDLDK